MFSIAEISSSRTLLRHTRVGYAKHILTSRQLSTGSALFEYKEACTCQDEDLTKLVGAMNALKTLHWFPASVRDIRAFRVEQWSDFTGFMKGTS